MSPRRAELALVRQAKAKAVPAMSILSGETSSMKKSSCPLCKKKSPTMNKKVNKLSL